MFEDAIAAAVEAAFKRLLSEKHLYQSVDVDEGFIPGTVKTWFEKNAREALIVGGFPKSGEELEEDARTELRQGWCPSNQKTRTLNRNSKAITFRLPTINTFCGHCGERWPFNPVNDGLTFHPDDGQDQWYYLGYECQQCKGHPVRFLVRRKQLKLQLCGRDPIEVLPTPKDLPKPTCKYFSDAQIAHHAGQTLAGLFLLRVFIEQFWRTLPPAKTLLQKNPRATGEELGEVYQKTLPDNFKNEFPSLPDFYGKLSAAIHSADASAEIFDEATGKIVEHFDARRLFKIK